MNTILEQYSDKIKGTFSFFDRMIIKGHILQLFSLSARNFFLSSLDVLKTNPVTERLICIISVVGNCQTWFPFMIRGFTNQEIRRAILAKLRAHGLIRKIPYSRRYVISDKGRRVLGGLIETKRKVYPEFAAI